MFSMDDDRAMYSDDGTLNKLLRQYNITHSERSVFLDGAQHREASYYSPENTRARMIGLEALLENFRCWLDIRETKFEAALNSPDPITRYEARMNGRLPDDWKE